MEVCVPPEDVTKQLIAAVELGNGELLRNVLSKYSISAVRTMNLFGDKLSIIFCAYLRRQIGLVRILVNEYKIDPNMTMGDDPCFYALFTACDSSDVCQSQIIDTIKEFSLNVQAHGRHLSVIHHVMLHKLFIVLRFLVEECKVDVNQKICSGLSSSTYFNTTGGTALHVAYAISEIDIAEYLIKHGADLTIRDSDSKTPKECYMAMPSRYPNYYSMISEHFAKRRVIVSNDKATNHYRQLLESGMPSHLAIDEASIAHADEVTPTQPLNLGTTPTMNKLHHYITDMAPSYYAIGLELGIPYSKLKVIKSDPSLVDLKEKCCKMLEVWLESDTSASWKKLCDALEDPEVSLCVLAERIKNTV